MDENTRLSDLTRMLLSSPSFSGFLDTLSQNPAAAQTAQQVTQPRVEQQQPQRQVRKDVNPYAAQQQMQQHQIGMAMIPEHNMDFSMLDLNGDGGYSYQPQVFSVLSMPETVIDTEVLSGKTSNSFIAPASDDEKVELPTIERAPVVEEPVKAVEVVDEEFDADPAFALFTATPSAVVTIEEEVSEPKLPFDFSTLSLKPATYELVTVSPAASSSSSAAMDRVERLSSQIDAVAERLSLLYSDF